MFKDNGSNIVFRCIYVSFVYVHTNLESAQNSREDGAIYINVEIWDVGGT